MIPKLPELLFRYEVLPFLHAHDLNALRQVNRESNTMVKKHSGFTEDELSHITRAVKWQELKTEYFSLFDQSTNKSNLRRKLRLQNNRFLQDSKIHATLIPRSILSKHWTFRSVADDILHESGSRLSHYRSPITESGIYFKRLDDYKPKLELSGGALFTDQDILTLIEMNEIAIEMAKEVVGMARGDRKRELSRIVTQAEKDLIGFKLKLNIP